MAVSDKRMWFGTLYPSQQNGTASTGSVAEMRWVPAPDTGMEATSNGYAELIQFENGGADVVRSSASSRSWSMDWSLGEASGMQGLDIISRYSRGEFGPGLIYWADPMNFDQNLFAPSFASPGLIGRGWPNIYTNAATVSNNATAAFDRPRTQAQWSITQAANTPPTGKNAIQTIPIPPTHTLWLGFSGVLTGAAAIGIRPILPGGGYGTTTYVSAVLNPANNTQLQNALQFQGILYTAVEVFLARTTSAASTVTLTSAMAQLWPQGVAPVLTGNHIAGQGNTGAKFSSDASPETYIMVDQSGTPRHYKGMSLDLIETGAWQV